jgi:predicted ribosome quality control (RQC) complex YloA/Tae2 family protein
MRLSELKALVKYLKKFKYIRRARRVEDNTIELSFDRNQNLFFNMKRGDSFIYKAPSNRPPRDYNAPFDTLLHSLFSQSEIVDIYLLNGDRVLKIDVISKRSYKREAVSIQFEFTGKNTNVILLNRDNIIIEALRHIDQNSSFRVVRPNIKLQELPPPPIKLRDSNLDSNMDIETLLEENFKDYEKRELERLKRQKLITVSKKKAKLEAMLESLPDIEQLEAEANKNREIANIILANLYKLKPYDTELETLDFEGNRVYIKFPKGVLVNRLSDYFFNRAKKAEKRAKYIHIEKENLKSKIDFYSNIYFALERAKSSYEVELLYPKRVKANKKREKIKKCELFWIDGYKVLIGRNSKENQELLKIAKANDIWLHVRDIPSSHLIIKTDKQNLPEDIIKKAGKLCVDFSIKRAGDYRVDYCKRKFVKIQEGSNVEYDKYKTITVRKDGIEIRE